MYHDFILVAYDEKFENYKTLTEDHLRVRVVDEIMQSMIDYLKWITFKNTNDEEKKGLNYYGISQLEGDNIEEFKRIILAIQNLFSIAPETFELTGFYDPDKEEYVQDRYTKESYLSVLKQLIELANQAERQEKKIIYYGI